MRIIVKRIYFKSDCTVGCLQVALSGSYESEVVRKTLKGRNKYMLRPAGTSVVASKEHCDVASNEHCDVASKSHAGGACYVLCDTIEHRVLRYIKSAIPEGEYKVVAHPSKTYKRVMPYVMGVQRFKGVVLRTGRTIADANSLGDIMVGQLTAVEGAHPSSNPNLGESRATFNLLFALIEEAVEHGEEVQIVVRSYKSSCNT